MPIKKKEKVRVIATNYPVDGDDVSDISDEEEDLSSDPHFEDTALEVVGAGASREAAAFASGLGALKIPTSVTGDLQECDLVGLKSVLFVELIARSAKMDVHSLNFPLVESPVWELIWALNTILDRDRKILIEGWEEGIWQLGPDDEQQLTDKAARVDLNALKEEWGISEFALGRDGVDAIRARTYEPTANIQGMIAGYTGPGRKTIIPNEARVRMDFRLIPNIQPADAIRKLKAHLEKHGFGHIEVQAFDGAEPPYKISVKEDISQAIIAAATEVYGELPVVNGVSAEGAILRHVWIPCVLTGFANPGANLHAPDENIRVDRYLQGIKYAAAIMEHFGRT